MFEPVTDGTLLIVSTPVIFSEQNGLKILWGMHREACLAIKGTTLYYPCSQEVIGCPKYTRIDRVSNYRFEKSGQYINLVEDASGWVVETYRLSKNSV